MSEHEEVIEETKTELPLENNKQQPKQEISLDQNSSPASKQVLPPPPVEKPVISKVEDFANEAMFFEEDQVVNAGITIRVSGSVQKGSSISKYTAYVIVGQDEKGKFQVLRRYSEFDALRIVLKDRWPGCFIPTLPDKAMTKNSIEIVQQRERLLDDFVKKIGHSKFLYYSQQFQLLLRSSEGDLSNTYLKAPKQTLQQIINRYKQSFAELAGKQVNSEASIKISTFKTALRKIQQKIPLLQEAALSLAESKARLNQRLPSLYNVITKYQKNTIVEFAQGNTESLVYHKEANAEFQKHAQTLKNVSKNNPYWLINDLIKVQIKDCQSFIETIEMVDIFSTRRLEVQGNIRSYEDQIQELALGRSTVSSMTTRKSKQQVKRLVEEKNKNAIIEKHQLIELGDMVVALLAYIEIDKYKKMKKKNYTSLIKKLAGFEGFVVLSLSKLWNDIQKETQPKPKQGQPKLEIQQHLQPQQPPKSEITVIPTVQQQKQ